MEAFVTCCTVAAGLKDLVGRGGFGIDPRPLGGKSRQQVCKERRPAPRFVKDNPIRWKDDPIVAVCFVKGLGFLHQLVQIGRHGFGGPALWGIILQVPKQGDGRWVFLLLGPIDFAKGALDLPVSIGASPWDLECPVWDRHSDQRPVRFDNVFMGVLVDTRSDIIGGDIAPKCFVVEPRDQQIQDGHDDHPRKNSYPRTLSGRFPVVLLGAFAFRWPSHSGGMSRLCTVAVAVAVAVAA